MMLTLRTRSHPGGMMPLCSLDEALEDLSSGKFVIVVDDEGRENEGDLFYFADRMTPEAITFMVTHARGLVCVAMQGDRLDELQIPNLRSRNSNSTQPTAFTRSVDYKPGTTTGISAHDRSATIRALVDAKSQPTDFIQPGHMFPLRAHPGGVLIRQGHTEAVVDMASLAGAYPAGVVCEIMNEDGTMSRLPDLEIFAAKHDIKIFSIAQLIAHRCNTETLITRVAEANLPTKYGAARIIGYRSAIDTGEHAALVVGEWQAGDEVLVRVHSECLTGDAFGSLKCDCGEQLDMAIRMIFENGAGALVYLRQEGRGIGLHNKIKAYALQDDGLDTIEANVALGFQPDERKYDLAVQIMRDLEISRARLVTK
ncbi:Riboflavin biosynthesis protein RibBA [Geodia barretti]|uniref:Riboflavin biosynthesis protein RibBA n=1 Tax=Geodia barretti TaxID=519541 RepID=A0AA35TT43_GEOBA|nr:Riboflavin biosynthesis protein RibBA [Geodia barretti]